MKHTLRASGLLFTVLTLAIFTTLSLSVVKSLLNISRSSAKVGTSRIAFDQAEQGLTEGAIWAANGLNDGLNGPSTSPAWYRIKDLLCVNFVDPVSTTQPTTNCPYYKYSVARSVTIDAVNKKKYQIPSNVFDREPNTKITMNYNHNVLFFKITESGDVSNNSPINYTCTNCIGGGTIYPYNPTVVTVSDTTKQVVVTFTKTLINLTAGSVMVEPNAADIISRGFTTIASTGFAGGITRRRFANIYDSDPTLYEYESSDDIDSNGCLANYHGTSGTDTSTCFTQRSDGTP